MLKYWDWWDKQMEKQLSLKRQKKPNSWIKQKHPSFLTDHQALDEFQEIVEYFKQHISPEATFEYYDTICRQVANRMPKLREFAATHDLIFFRQRQKEFKRKNAVRGVFEGEHQFTFDR